MPAIVNGFLTRLDREDHFQNHQHEFDPPFTTVEEYETAAMAFLTTPSTSAIMEGVRRNGDIVRYDPLSNEFAICDRDGTILTYFKPTPVVHRERDNVTYFRKQCLK